MIDRLLTIDYKLKESKTPYQVQYFKNDRGRSVFLEWLKNLDDPPSRAKIKVQIDRLARGNFGRCRSLSGGLHEAKINFGPGYRIYFGVIEQKVIVVLGGGTKRSQSHDIEIARGHWIFLQEILKDEKKG